jgi:hypothetical protein
MGAKGVVRLPLNGDSMSWPSEHYRQLALDAREHAATSTLPQVKIQYLRSAEHFDEIVAKLESVAEAKIRNEAARAEAVI